MKPNKIFAALAATAALLATPVASQAAPLLAAKISDGFSTITIFDGGLGDASGVDGILAFTGLSLFGNWDVAFVVGTSTFNPLQMHMSSGFSALTSNFGVGESKVLTISLSQTGLSSGAGTGLVQFGAHGGGSGQGGTTSTWSAYADDADALFGTSTLVTSSPDFTTWSGGLAASMTDDYSATLVATFDVSKASGIFASGSQDLTMNVPEPGTVALAGLALLGLGATRRRRQV